MGKEFLKYMDPTWALLNLINNDIGIFSMFFLTKFVLISLINLLKAIIYLGLVIVIE